MLRVEDCMERKPRTVTPGSTLHDAIKLMLDHHLDGLAVVDKQGHCLGLLTLGYLLRGFMPDHLREQPDTLLEELEDVNVLAFFGPTRGLFLVEDFYKHDVQPLAPDNSLLLAATEMRRQMLGLLPVVARGKLAGIIAHHNIMKAFFDKASR